MTPIERIPVTGNKYSADYERLRSEVLEIISQKVQLCEIDPGNYNHNSVRDVLKRAIRRACFEYNKDHNAHISWGQFDIMSRRIDNKYHWYIQFNFGPEKEETCTKTC